MNVQYYTPMKHPSHPVPSGDRLMAQLLHRCLEICGHQVTLAAGPCTYDGIGDPLIQQRLRAAADAQTDSLLQHYAQGAAKPDLWFTYHVYHKAPDWIGPAVSRALSIPYVIAEASYASKAAALAWEMGARSAELSIRSADLVFSITSTDRDGIAHLLTPRQTHLDLPPFLDPAPYASFPPRSRHGDAPVELLTVAMMRAGDKLESYRRLAEYLQHCAQKNWRLSIVGDGPARKDVEKAMALLASGQVRFLGQIQEADLLRVYTQSDLFVWPAAGEAYGMAMLEAQAAGLPVIAGRGRGVEHVVCDGKTGFLTPDGDREAFAGVVDFLISDANARRQMGVAAAQFVRLERNLDSACEILRRGFDALSRPSLKARK